LNNPGWKLFNALSPGALESFARRFALLLWGDRDWSRPDEREHARRIVPGAGMATVGNGGHFLPLDRPDAVIEYLLAFQSSAG
jgi:pimeloyl-ACP methyl ester carboxylesterase